MDRIPDEILVMIVKELIHGSKYPWTGDEEWWLRRTTTVRPLPLVSRRFYSIANPLLYEDINAPTFITHKAYAILAKTMYQNPRLAQSIKRIHVEGLPLPATEDPPDDLRLNLLHLRDLVQRLGTTQDIDELERRSRINCDNILLTFWILQATKVKTLYLNPAIAGWGERYDWSRDPATSDLPLFIEEFGRAIYADFASGFCRYDSLRNLRLDLSWWYDFHHSTVFPFLLLPNLKTLELIGWGHLSEKVYIGEIDPRDCYYGSKHQWPVRSTSLGGLHIPGSLDTKVSKPSTTLTTPTRALLGILHIETRAC